MSDRNVNRATKRKRSAEDKVDLSSVGQSSSSNDNQKNVKKSKNNNESAVENNGGTEQSTETFDFLKEALKKLHELENEIAAIEEGTEDEAASIDYEKFEENALAFEAEAIGFAVCARETLNYLASQGLTSDSPLVKSLRDRLVGKCKQLNGCEI
ncbi:hypothetical protein HA402_006049 [Bradysia odoriphaga]|nr:hypothetical protein HA402_006049 [Bradysia odoriphaga]